MHPILGKTFGGLAPAYYFRQFVFGLIFPALFVLVLTKSAHPPPVTTGAWVVVAANTLLYPYSRFVYEGLADFIRGNNILFFPMLLMLIWKIATMWICWALAFFLAPVGLLFLYAYHSWRERRPAGRH